LPASSDTCQSGNDANCNGTPNEGCTCLVGQTRTCAQGGLYGKCASGTETCYDSGQWGPCSITPSANDTCVAGNDDNCNGKVNEACPCTQGTTRACSQDGLLGKCASGTETCDGTGKWGACTITPSSADTCAAGNDDNCNGIPNEGCLCLLGASRNCGLCNDGTQSCTDGKAGTYGSCTGGTQPKTYFRDADGDGHGNPNITSSTCGSAPTGYVASNDDCCDSNSLVYPGNTNWYATPHSETPACATVKPFDYDCDGKETVQIATTFDQGCQTGPEGNSCVGSGGWYVAYLPDGYTYSPNGPLACGQAGTTAACPGSAPCWPGGYQDVRQQCH
jgi:hypothetical protein